uniref:IGF-like family receptor 1 n=1 Tax=Amphiprion percula TaxID=161767 RepID=A0A3P8T8T5_AMPPE
MGPIKRCPDPTTRWDPISRQCILCNIRPGGSKYYIILYYIILYYIILYYIILYCIILYCIILYCIILYYIMLYYIIFFINIGFDLIDHCGHDDYGSSHQAPHKRCKPDTFNDGSSPYCKPCSMCASGHVQVTPCNATTDIVCSDMSSCSTCQTESPTIKWKDTLLHLNLYLTLTFAVFAGAAPLAILISIMLAALLAFILKMKRKRGSCKLKVNDHNILSAPLQMVLDNLDVLEELVILLDPETHGIKNTKHLASLCSFPSTWVTYTYSMKESKSPLKALLEAVSSKNPDWTVGHLAKLLRHMERNDAIAALAKLR